MTSLVEKGNLYPSYYIACKYNNLWYFRIITEVNKEKDDAIIKFLHPAEPSPSFYWQKREDIFPVHIP